MARRHPAPSTTAENGPADAELTLRATKGDSIAFEELYRRHSEAAWRVAYAVSGNPHDASDAVSEAFTRVFAAMPAGRFPAEAPFRPYLLTATRNAAIDGVRRGGKLRPSEVENLDIETAAASPSDAAIGALDSSLVATAFLSLPERWRSVLWLTEVEGLQPREVAGMLGISANGAAQPAVRARAGLRDHFLQAHLRGEVDRECKFTVDHLGAYVGGALSARDVAKVDQHLTGCAACRRRQAELEDVGSTLRKIVLPIPLGLGAIAAARWKLAATAAAHAGRKAFGAAVGGVRAVRPLAIAASVTLALGIIGAAVVNPDSGTELGTRPRNGPRQSSGPVPVVQGFTVAPPVAASAIESVNEVAVSQAALAATARPAPGSSQSGNSSPPPPPANNGGGGGEPAAPVVQVSTVATPVEVGLVLGDACTGADIAGAVIGCPPPAPSPTAVIATVETHGDLLGDSQIAL
jgi:RNA polymerase sigma factor (sigma-70 family)